MSTDSDRDAIVAALSGVAGVAGYPARPAALAKGAAWPLWISATKLTACSLLDTWWVWVVLAAGDEASVARLVDELLAPVWVALEEIADVSIVEGLSIEVDVSRTQVVPVLRYTITTTRDKEKT